MGGYLCLIHAWWKCICISRDLSAVGLQYGKPYGQRLIHEGFSQTNTPVNAGLLVVMNNLLRALFMWVFVIGFVVVRVG